MRRLLPLLLIVWGCPSNDDDSVSHGENARGPGADAGAIGDAADAANASFDSGSPGNEGGASRPDGSVIGLDGGNGGPRYALDFPSNVTGGDQSAPFVALQYDDPHLNGLPFAGPSNAGVTYMWRVKHRAQTGYYVTLWWSQGNGGFTPDHQYVGGHPY